MDIRVTVTIADSHLSRIDEVVRRLRTAGMTVEQVLDTIGIVTGSVPEADLPRIRAVPGVADVSEEATFEPQ